ncbi:IS30 family transposase [Solimonas sp. K1W22B-7]|uniref:IS30 family transposase n=1 Tax=Solimonas sp. K1W22B-7 TaxID=2303331 RepID=UPI000E32E6FA|nr:IS30 family transposase [Solimonas sp. K1W22B-7]AXQ29880.1 IS30 family transposase [Solimonas sp. K1W22B-7]
MGRKSFEQFGIEERCEISRRRQAGESIRQIAAALDRAPSSISRELKRNTGATGYQSVYAGEQARARRWQGSRLLRDAELQARVLEGLRRGWSPEQVSRRLAQQDLQISYESIYRFIAAQIARTNDFSWRLYLPRAKSKRGFRGRKGGSPAEHIQQRVSIEKRPKAAADRRQAGHWEADLMLFARYGQAILTLHERTSRLTAIVRQPSKAAAPVAQTLQALLAPLPPALRRSITFDNGTEFALHYTLHQPLGLQTYFCDPHSPWQKGGVENANGRLRRWLPRGTNVEDLSPDQLLQIAQIYNHTPRKCLGFKTPAEVFAKVLHFKCESTYRLPPV